MSITLKTDGQGNIVTCPMTGYELRTAGDAAMLVVIEYVETPEQLETGERSQLQAIMTPKQALELAESLKRSATVLMTPDSNAPIH